MAVRITSAAKGRMGVPYNIVRPLENSLIYNSDIIRKISFPHITASPQRRIGSVIPAPDGTTSGGSGRVGEERVRGDGPITGIDLIGNFIYPIEVTHAT